MALDKRRYRGAATHQPRHPQFIGMYAAGAMLPGNAAMSIRYTERAASREQKPYSMHPFMRG